MRHMEYREFEVPSDVRTRLEKLSQMANGVNPDELEPDHRPTFGNAGLFEWLTRLSREEGWRVVWQTFNFPFIVLEREVVLEEVEN